MLKHWPQKLIRKVKRLHSVDEALSVQQDLTQVRSVLLLRSLKGLIKPEGEATKSARKQRVDRPD